MGCKTSIRCESSNKKIKKRPNIEKLGSKSEQYSTNNLKNIGREQFFYHYPPSKIPIRVIASTNNHKEGKTEPHIEIGAENYLRTCLPKNIRDFCNSDEKFLFLCTTCENKELKKFIGKRFVVGYIEKKNCKKMVNDHLAVIGKKIYMVPFDKKMEYGNLGINRSRGMQKFDKEHTRWLLKLIHSHKSITSNCMDEMIKWENIERKKNKYIPYDEECLGKDCLFKKECLRKKIK